MCRFCAAPSTCDSPSHENATEPPSGESDGIASFPAAVVTGTRRGAATGPSRKNTAQVIAPSARTAAIPAANRTRLLNDGGASGARGLPSNPSLMSRSSTFTSAMCCTRRDTIFSEAAQDQPFEISRHSWRQLARRLRFDVHDGAERLSGRVSGECAASRDHLVEDRRRN